MARPVRIEFAGAWYYVISRAVAGVNLFGDDQDTTRFFDIMSDSCQRFGVQIHGYFLAADNFQLIVYTPHGNLTNFMKQFNVAYTVYFNRRYRRSGAVYHGRYRGVVVEAETYLLELSRFLHLSPIRALTGVDGDADDKLKLVREYQWSSLKGYLAAKQEEPTISYDRILGIFGGSAAAARQAYLGYIKQGLTKGSPNLLKAIRRQILLGSDEFVAAMKHRVSHQVAKRALSRVNMPIREIARIVAREYKTPAIQLLMKRSVQREARQFLIELCCRYGSRTVSLHDVGAQLGHIDISAVVHCRRRLAVKLKKDKNLRKRFEKLVEQLDQLQAKPSDAQTIGAASGV